MIGDAGAGKSCLLLRFIENRFSDDYQATIGVDFKVKNVQIDDDVIKLQVWDTAGQERFRNITTSYYRGSSGIIIVFDLTDRVSFDHVPYWIKEVEKLASPEVKTLLVGNKLDLEEQRQVSKKEAKTFAKQVGLPYIEVSALEDINVTDLFEGLARQIKESQEAQTTTVERESANAVQLPLSRQPDKKSKSCC